MGAVELVGSFRNAFFDDGEGRIGAVFQGHHQSLFLGSGEAGEHMVRQVLIGVCLAAHADFHPGECLGTQLRNDGFDAVVAAGAAVGPDPQPTGLQGDIVKEDDDPGRGDVKVGGQLQHASAGEVHISLGLQQKELSAVIVYLAVKTLEFQFIHLAA